MLFSIAVMLLVGMAASALCRKIKLPGLMGMVLTGIVIGPYVLNLIDESILNISAELRKIALIIILMRAGLTLRIEDLKKVGRPAILMCFVPALCEIAGMILLAPALLGVTKLQAALIGTVVAAVSPAVIVPKMIKLTEEGYGTAQSIPQMILAGASVDDVFVIVLFTACTALCKGEKVSPMEFVNIPVSIALGIAVGLLTGGMLAWLFRKYHMRDTVKVFLLLSVAFLLVTAEEAIPVSVTFSALLSIMFMGVALKKYRAAVAGRLSTKLNKLWVGAEVMLFVLVGATVDLAYVKKAGIAAVLLIFGGLLFRMAGVGICLLRTTLTGKERLFCMIAYLPKATVQAAIGSVPLAMGIEGGEIVLMVAVLAILITAPLGAFGVDMTYRRFLTKEKAEG